MSQLRSTSPEISAPRGNENGVAEDAVIFGMESTTNSFSLDEENRGFCLAFQERNEVGPIHGRTILWKGYTRSSGAAVDEAVINARKLVLEDHVFALVNFGGPEAMLLADFTETNKVPYLFPHTTLFASTDKRYVFTSLPHCTGEMRVTMRHVSERGLRRIALIRDVNEYGDIYLDLLHKHASEFDYCVTGVAELAERDPADVSDALISVVNGGADAVFMALYPAQARALMLAKARLGWRGRMISSGPLTDEQYLGSTGESAEGTLGLCHFPDPALSDEPGIARYRAAMRRHHPGRQFNRYTLYGYVYGKLVIDALERAGPDLTRETFVNAMESTRSWNSGGMIPPVTLSKHNHHAQRAGLIAELRNGRFQPVSGWVE